MTDDERKRWAEQIQPGDVVLEKYSIPGGKGKLVTILARREVDHGCESGVFLSAMVKGIYGTFRQELDSHWFWPNEKA